MPWRAISLLWLVWPLLVHAQRLDRVLARVDAVVITETDLKAALTLGLVEAALGPAGEGDALEQLIERQAMLAELERFRVPQPEDSAIDELSGAMLQRLGPRLQSLTLSTGVDAARIREAARDTLRIQASIRQRFGAAATLADPEVRQWRREVRARATVIEVGGKD